MLANNTVKNVSVTYGSVFNAVAKSVCNSVIPPTAMPCKTFCFVSFDRPALCSVCAFTMDFVSVHEQINLK